MGCIDFERAAVLLFQRCGNHSANPFLLRPSTFDAGLWHSCLRFSSSKRWSLFSLVSVRLFRTVDEIVSHMKCDLTFDH
ncbi:hypothetical protein T08_15892 [Trichinella sp. T8]|nr:hypothetical protein T08_15892 [Trichinella sp. T8]